MRCMRNIKNLTIQTAYGYPSKLQLSTIMAFWERGLEALDLFVFRNSAKGGSKNHRTANKSIRFFSTDLPWHCFFSKAQALQASQYLSFAAERRGTKPEIQTWLKYVSTNIPTYPHQIHIDIPSAIVVTRAWQLKLTSLKNIKIKHILYYLYWHIISITNSACQPSISLNDIVNPSAILSMPSSPMRLFRRFKDCKEEFLESQFQNGGVLSLGEASKEKILGDFWERMYTYHKSEPWNHVIKF